MDLWVSAASPARRFTEALAWLWQLSWSDEARPLGGVGVGVAREAFALTEHVAEGRLAGAVILAGSPQAGFGPVPASKKVDGVARFPGYSLAGEFTVLQAEHGVLESSIGVHAAEAHGILTLGCGPDGGWGTLHLSWALEAIGNFLEATGGSRLTKLPPVGCIRLDDFPGTAEFQLDGVAKSDRKQARRAKLLREKFAANCNVLNLATSCEALLDGERVPLETVWPQSISELRDGVAAGVVEPVCHGLLGLVPEDLADGRTNFREYAELDEETAGDVLDRVVEWQRANLGEPHSFVAVAWDYSPGTRTAAEARGLPCWERPSPGPLIEDGALTETLVGALPGLNGVDFRPVAALAEAGLPPVLTMHGLSLDDRRETMGGPLNAARLVLERDIFRLAALAGVKWVGSSEMFSAWENHAPTPVRTGQLVT
ncbi:MAG: hypothetical protein QOI31_209 [Solirubrobacterales bacterium]|nr:hypothetical protein [Solirubrobacterales bacterium]